MDILVRDLTQLSGHQFESLMVTVFQRLGYDAEHTSLSNDGGRDIILKQGDDVIVVECKHQKASVGRPVVQKLHSAVTTYHGATGAILVTTGRFSEAASLYTTEVAAISGIQIQLWDRDALIETSRRVGVVLRTGTDEHDLFFIANRRPQEQLEEAVKGRIVEHISSFPRPVENVTTIKLTGEEFIPAIVIEYDVDRPFHTTVGIIYQAKAQGRIVLPLLDSSESEQEYWAATEPQLLDIQYLNGTAVAPMFDSAVTGHQHVVASQIAESLSRNVQYWGRNNQFYKKYCEVRPGDVVTSVKQVLFQRQQIEAVIGPREYQLRTVDDYQRQPEVVEDDGCVALRTHSVLCNDCGELASRVRGVPRACGVCGRTLCGQHLWKWLVPFAPDEHLCFNCVKIRRKHDAWLRMGTKGRLFGIPGYAGWIDRNWLVILAMVATAVALVLFDWRTIPAIWGINALFAFYGRRVSNIRREATASAEQYSPEWIS